MSQDTAITAQQMVLSGQLSSDNGHFHTDGVLGNLTAASLATTGAVSAANATAYFDVNGNVNYGAVRGQGESTVPQLQTLTANGQTITIPANCTLLHITGGSAWTGLILANGSQAGQQIFIINDSANAQTFASAGTSHVAEGVSANVPANGKLLLVWSANLALWV